MKSSRLKKNQTPASSFPKKYVMIAVAVAVAVVAVISVLFGGRNSFGGGGAVDETEAQSRWKETGPAKKK